MSKKKDEEERYVLTPKGCLCAALIESYVNLSDETIDIVWDNFEKAMMNCGYIKEEKKKKHK